jgi:altronate hydrolase
MKISTNTALYENKPHWIDYDAVVLLEEESVTVLSDLVQYIIKVASGAFQ